MKKLMKQKAAYALALLLGLTSVVGGTAVSLPEMRTVHAAEAVTTVSTADEIKTAWTNGGEIKLVQQITGASSLTTNKDVTLNLNGQSLQINGGITVASGSSLTITGSGTIKGNGTSEGGGVIYVNSGSLNLQSGTITSDNKTSGIIVRGGTVTMSGGEITNNKSLTSGGGIAASENSALTMSGGTISNNSAAYNGGGIYFDSGSTFTMTGGSITGNTAGQQGGGVFQSGMAGTYNKTGGVISGNTAQLYSDEAVYRDGKSSSSSSASSNSATSTTSTNTSSSSRSSSSSSSSSSSGSSGSSSSGYSAGDVRTAGSGSASADYVKTGASTVRYDATAVSGNATSAKVPATVKIGGKTYAVTTIAADAFKGNTKLKTVAIGKNIKKIDAGAFSGCTNLKTLTVNSRNLTKKSVKGAFKGASLKTVSVPSNKVQPYKSNVFTKANTGNKTKISVKAKKTGKKK